MSSGGSVTEAGIKSSPLSRAKRRWQYLFTFRSRTSLSDPEALQLHSTSGMTRTLHTTATKGYLSKIANGAEISEPLSIQQQAYLDYVWAKVRVLPADRLVDLLSTQTGTRSVAVDDVFEMLSGIAEVANSTDHLSVDRAVDHLINTGVFRPIPVDSVLFSRARYIVYIAISWICMIYSPLELKISEGLQLDEQQLVDINTTRRDICEARNPICEVLQQFGPLLPVRYPRLPSDPLQSDPSFQVRTLYVSLLNAKTLSQIGQVDIKWVDNVSSHLLFDKERKCLLLFSLPSFCHINRHDNTTFSRIISDYYDQYSRPDEFSVVAFLGEIRLSYRLLFGDDKRGHDHFLRISKESSFSFGFRDPYLSDLSKDNSGSRTSTDTYSTATDFPILGSRLLALQAYMKTRNCGTIKMLWQDRRDMLRWYTFWVVTIIGGLGIFLSFGQLALSAAQVYYSIPAHIGKRGLWSIAS